MALRVYESGEAVEYRDGSGKPWRRGVYEGPVEDLPGDHWLEGGIGVSGRHLRHARTKAKPSRPERPRRPTTGAHAARSHSLEAPALDAQPRPLGPWRCRKYLDYVRSQPCCVCGDRERNHAHHEAGPGERGTGTKASDALVVPLCPADHVRRHHDGTPDRARWTPAEWQAFAREEMARLWREWIERGSR